MTRGRAKLIAPVALALAASAVMGAAGALTAKAFVAIPVAIVTTSALANRCTPGAVGILVTSLALAPDTPKLMTISGFGITPRWSVLILAGLLAAVWSLRGDIELGHFGFLPVAAYSLVAVLGCILTHHLQAIPIFALVVLLPFWLGLIAGSSRPRLEAAMAGLSVAAVVLSLVAMAEFLRHRSFLPPVDAVDQYVRAGNIRAFAGWSHPLALGMFLVIAIFPATQYVARFGFLVAPLTALVIGIGIFTTQERSPIIGAVAGVSLMVLVQPSLARRARQAAGAVATSALVLALPGPGASAFRSFLTDSTVAGSDAAGNVGERSHLFSQGVSVASQSPWIGHGFDTATSGHANLVAYGHYVFNDIANLPLAIAIETGFIGLGCYLVLIVASCWRGVRWRRDRMLLALFTSVAGGFVTSIGVTQYSSWAFLTLMAACLGRAGSYGYVAADPNQTPTAGDAFDMRPSPPRQVAPSPYPRELAPR